LNYIQIVSYKVIEGGLSEEIIDSIFRILISRLNIFIIGHET